MSQTTFDKTGWVTRAAALRRHARLWRGCFSLALVREAQFRAHFLTTVVIGALQLHG